MPQDGRRLKPPRATAPAPGETRGIAVLSRSLALAASTGAPETDLFRLVLEDRAMRNLHLTLLSDRTVISRPDRQRLAYLLRAALRRETASISRDDWVELPSDAPSLRAI